jgi:hypothetical protein
VVRGHRIAPPGTEVRNPAFDVTPAELITGIVTEEGVIRPPFGDGLAAAIAAAAARWGPTRPPLSVADENEPSGEAAPGDAVSGEAAPTGDPA